MNYTNTYYSPKQGRFPVFISDFLEISDSVITFDHIMEEIEITRYLKSTTTTAGRKGYNSVNMLKTILFGFMDKGYISLRELEDECKVKAIPHKDRLTTLYRICLIFFRHTAQKSLDIRQYACKIDLWQLHQSKPDRKCRRNIQSNNIIHNSKRERRP